MSRQDVTVEHVLAWEAGEAEVKASQEYRDGLALRLLREALPPDHIVSLWWTLDGLWHTDVETGTGPVFDDTFDRSTIAAACDAAREALEART